MTKELERTKRDLHITSLELEIYKSVNSMLLDGIEQCVDGTIRGQSYGLIVNKVLHELLAKADRYNLELRQKIYRGN